MTAHRLVFAGQYGSPYTLKMRAVLRYRRVPFRWVLRDSKWDDLPDVAVRIIPVIVFPDADGHCDEGRGEAMVDSSPQIMRLERQYEGRSVVPGDPALAFIDALIEDFADEWLTKAMYHYRWAYEPDIDKAGKLLPLSQDLQMDAEEAEGAYELITTRQIGRRALVGPGAPMCRSCSPMPPRSAVEPMRSYARSPGTSIARPHSSTRESVSAGSATTTTRSQQPTAPASTRSSPAPVATPCSPKRRITASAQ